MGSASNLLTIGTNETTKILHTVQRPLISWRLVFTNLEQRRQIKDPFSCFRFLIMKVRRTTLLPFLLTAAGGGYYANAHVGVSPAEVKSGERVIVGFRIGHGCGNDTDTIGVTITMPDGILNVQAAQDPGYDIMHSMMRPLDPPVIYNGREYVETVDNIHWHGHLPMHLYHFFTIQFQVMDFNETTSLPFAVEQKCTGDMSYDWSSLDPSDPHPAPRLVVKKAKKKKSMSRRRKN